MYQSNDKIKFFFLFICCCLEKKWTEGRPQVQKVALSTLWVNLTGPFDESQMSQ